MPMEVTSASNTNSTTGAFKPKNECIFSDGDIKISSSYKKKETDQVYYLPFKPMDNEIKEENKEKMTEISGISSLSGIGIGSSGQSVKGIQNIKPMGNIQSVQQIPSVLPNSQSISNLPPSIQSTPSFTGKNFSFIQNQNSNIRDTIQSNYQSNLQTKTQNILQGNTMDLIKNKSSLNLDNNTQSTVSPINALSALKPSSVSSNPYCPNTNIPFTVPSTPNRFNQSEETKNYLGTVTSNYNSGPSIKNTSDISGISFNERKDFEDQILKLKKENSELYEKLSEKERIISENNSAYQQIESLKQSVFRIQSDLDENTKQFQKEIEEKNTQIEEYNNYNVLIDKFLKKCNQSIITTTNGEINFNFKEEQNFLLIPIQNFEKILNEINKFIEDILKDNTSLKNKYTEILEMNNKLIVTCEEYQETLSKLEKERKNYINNGRIGKEGNKEGVGNKANNNLLIKKKSSNNSNVSNNPSIYNASYYPINKADNVFENNYAMNKNTLEQDESNYSNNNSNFVMDSNECRIEENYLKDNNYKGISAIPTGHRNQAVHAYSSPLIGRKKIEEQNENYGGDHSDNSNIDKTGNIEEGEDNEDNKIDNNMGNTIDNFIKEQNKDNYQNIEDNEDNLRMSPIQPNEVNETNISNIPNNPTDPNDLFKLSPNNNQNKNFNIDFNQMQMLNPNQLEIYKTLEQRVNMLERELNMQRKNNKGSKGNIFKTVNNTNKNDTIVRKPRAKSNLRVNIKNKFEDIGDYSDIPQNEDLSYIGSGSGNYMDNSPLRGGGSQISDTKPKKGIKKKKKVTHLANNVNNIYTNIYTGGNSNSNTNNQKGNQPQHKIKRNIPTSQKRNFTPTFNKKGGHKSNPKQGNNLRK